MQNTSFDYITSQNDLQRCCEALADSKFLAVDTEFHREKSYYPELALIQVSDGKNHFVIDPLEISDIQPFYDLIYDTNIVKVLHSARQDYEIFYYQNNRLPEPIFDTQVAASLLGYGEQIGYAALVKNLLQIEVDKSQTRTDWLKRPLNNKQLEYAAGDVIHLAEIYPLMHAELEKLGRLDWLDEDFNVLSSVDTYRVDARNLWKRLKSASRLSGLRLAIVQELCEWRELSAMRKNVIRKFVLNDDSIIDIANQQPDSIDSLRGLRGFNQRLKTDELNQIIQCINKAKSRDQSDWPKHPKFNKPTQQQSAITDVLTAIVSLRATESAISPAFICSKKDLTNLVLQSDSKLLHGWRKKLVGDDLTHFLHGQADLCIQDDKLKIIDKT